MSRRQFSFVAWVPVVVLLLLLVTRLLPGPHSRDAQVARGLVEAAYRTASTGAISDLPEHREWEAIEQKYGQVQHWRILGSHRDFLYGDWFFNVEVTRERAVTQEQVDAMAGPSRLYGYYSAIVGVKVDNARLLPKI